MQESRPAFFEVTFRLKKQLSAAQVDLWRLKRVADELVARRGAGAAAVDAYTRFESDIDYLYDTMLNIREEVLSVIDLHLNVVSFEMNRVMRVLAVIGALGLIPAIVAGLIAPPSMLALPQVAFLHLLRHGDRSLLLPHQGLVALSGSAHPARHGGDSRHR